MVAVLCLVLETLGLGLLPCTTEPKLLPCSVFRTQKSLLRMVGSGPDGSSSDSGAPDSSSKDDDKGLGSLQAFLDRPVFDPDIEKTTDPQLLKDFKKLVATDYATAEALYAGIVFAMLLFLSQHAVRLWKSCYAMPDNTCPDIIATKFDPFAGL